MDSAWTHTHATHRVNAWKRRPNVDPTKDPIRVKTRLLHPIVPRGLSRGNVAGRCGTVLKKCVSRTTINSFSPQIKKLFPHRIVMAKGNVGNFTVVHQDATIYTNGITLTSAANHVKLYIPFKRALPNGIYKYVFDIFLTSSEVVKIYLYGQCGERGFRATTRYEHWSGSAHGATDQASAAGGYFSRIHGNYLHLTGSFRNTNQKVTNYGKGLP